MEPELKERLMMGFDFVEDDLSESFDEISSGGTDSWLVGVFPPRYRSHISREMCLMFMGLLQVLRPKILGPNPWLVAPDFWSVFYGLRGVDPMPFPV